MTRDEIVQIAWDVGILMRSHHFQDEPTKLERFAERIAAAEREACAKVAGPHLYGEIAAAIRARGEE
jgi:predicted component of type VI protein secretion system